MNRRQRTETLINSSSNLATVLADEIKGRYDIDLMEEPNHGLVMVKVRETAKKSLFYLGEVLVTECKVQIAGKMGVGLIKGDEPEKSYDLAIIDAAYAAELVETAAWSAKLYMEHALLEQAYLAEHAKVMRTKVDFETMDTDSE
ncbi:alpha-D-ribose 1-methylphosphonate 5-triphosphate synthase subunit PhnG [Paenibacillus sp. PastF-3]|uniref:phosphonate C-P lyase system protein PhnG n=1 Tax=Paenibacillus sp. PastF-3 TaxID=2940626 RepID=UPI002474B456|nr:phosphonate C-P lyase system protein PhnG [Paenibacillus sp. PastF-3]MDH6374060.1 alpha-D-ribose 1-methylphosphonate 5-triphosphate synthase subunit PhnG [Paenibacillus sp. PastF-3]